MTARPTQPNGANVTIPCTMGDCCRVRPCPESGGVWLSSTRRPGLEVLLDGDEWAAHLADVKAGKYDEAARRAWSNVGVGGYSDAATARRHEPSPGSPKAGGGSEQLIRRSAGECPGRTGGRD